ncbi:ATP-binding protein [Alkaliphilus pronyensis]|uniref:ATP-binding protein n=1 Tax=Alkaliphilus pronyensis TaxID=1482732 RepID=A0A6I0F842_9FIRM|nr:ATP-binding protein [Alkaliphilus pronyensis]KAB3534496.1 ATP-binding protein [Alkaliphilus pronyensis]
MSLIGKVIATEKVPTTMDEFGFWTKKDLILNPFDVVKVDHVKDSATYAVIEEISHITDSASFLSNFISNDFGEVTAEESTMRIGMNYVKAKVVGNDKNIFIPVQSNSKVYMATKEEVSYALGLKDIKNPLVCGYLEMYENTNENSKIVLPVHIDSKFLIGPEGAHLNISGISGLASKTSYGMFLLKAIQDKCLAQVEEEANDNTAFVVFNVKGKDLLAIDEPNEFNDYDNMEKNNQDEEEVKELYKMLGLTTEPFKNVTYLYPCSGARVLNTYADKYLLDKQIAQKKAFKYKFEYEYDKDSLDLMFANVEDSTQTMDSILNYIINGYGNFGRIEGWSDFIEELDKMCESGNSYQQGKEITVQSWRKFTRMIKKSIMNNELFSPVKSASSEIRIAEKISEIKKNDVFVVDIAKLNTDMQAYVFGNTIRELYNLQLGEKESNGNAPSKIIIFIDELNKFASSEVPKNSPILRQILDIAERGRSLGVILFGAEQFRSAIHQRVTGNSATAAYGRTNAIELAKGDYKYVPAVYKSMMTRLKQGEYIIQNPIFRSLLNIKFPKPIYKQFK